MIDSVEEEGKGNTSADEEGIDMVRDGVMEFGVRMKVGDGPSTLGCVEGDKKVDEI